MENKKLNRIKKDDYLLKNGNRGVYLSDKINDKQNDLNSTRNKLNSNAVEGERINKDEIEITITSINNPINMLFEEDKGDSIEFDYTKHLVFSTFNGLLPYIYNSNELYPNYPVLVYLDNLIFYNRLLFQEDFQLKLKDILNLSKDVFLSIKAVKI